MDYQSTPPSICTTRKRLDAARRVLFVAAGYLGLPASCVPVAPMARFGDPAVKVGGSLPSVVQPWREVTEKSS